MVDFYSAGGNRSAELRTIHCGIVDLSLDPQAVGSLGNGSGRARVFLMGRHTEPTSRFVTVMDVEFLEHIVNVILHCREGYLKALRDLLVGQSLVNECRHLLLSVTQVCSMSALGVPEGAYSPR